MISKLASRLSPSECRWLAIFIGAAFWFFPSKGHADVILALVGVYGLLKFRETVALWRNPAGVLFGLGALFVLLSWSWSFFPKGTERDMAKALPMVFAVFGLPRVFNSPQRIWFAIIASAGLITIRLALELVRVFYDLGWPHVLREARFHEVYLYTHPQVSSMMAGLCVLVFAAALLRWEGGWRRNCLFIAGLLLNAIYLWVMASRGAQGVLALVFLIAPVLVMPTCKSRMIMLMLAIAVGFALVPLAKIVNPRFNNQRDMTTFSSRTRVWNYTLHLMETRPWLGYGFGKNVFDKAVYHNPEKARAPRWSLYYPHAHSYWLMTYFQGGRIGAVLFGAAWLALLVRLLRRGRDEVHAGDWLERMRSRVPWALMVAMISYILIYGIIDYPDHLIRHVQFFLIGLILAFTAKPAASRA